MISELRRNYWIYVLKGYEIIKKSWKTTPPQKKQKNKKKKQTENENKW